MKLLNGGLALALTVALTAVPARAEDPEFASYGLVQAPPTEKSNELVNEMLVWSREHAEGEKVFEKAVRLVGKDDTGKHLVQTARSIAARVLALPESAGRTEAALVFLKVTTQYLRECRNVEANMDRLDSWCDGRFARMTEVEIRNRCADMIAMEGANIVAWLSSGLEGHLGTEVSRYRNKYVDPSFEFLPDAFEQMVWSGPWNDPGSDYDRSCCSYVRQKVSAAITKLAARVLYIEKKYGKPDDERVISEARNVGYLIGSYHAGMSRALESRYDAAKAAEESEREVMRLVSGGANALSAGFASWEFEAVRALSEAIAETGHGESGGADALRARGKRANDGSAAEFRALVHKLLRKTTTHGTPFHEAMDAMTEIRVNFDRQ